MKTRFSHAAAFGAAAGMAVIALSLLIYALDLHEAMNYLSYIIIIAVLCIGVKKWREQEGGYLTFGGAYKHLLLQSLVYTLIMAVWVFVFVSYIAPGMFESKLLEIEMQMEAQGQPQEAIDMAMKWTRWMMQPGAMVIWTLLGYAVYAVLNLILAAIMKKDPPPAEFFPPVDAPYSNAPFPGQPGNNPYQQPPSNFPPQQ
jgi:hypothetical protein